MIGSRSSTASSGQQNPVLALLFQQKYLLTCVALFSGVINVLALTGSFYMLQVYDRVIPSRSIATLIGLSILILVLFAINGLLEFIRSRIMSRLGTALDVALSPQVFKAMQLLPLRSRAGGDGMQPLRDLDQVRSFMSGVGPTALFDLPWIPIYVLFVYLLHPMLALVAVSGAFVLIGLTALTEYKSNKPLKAAAVAGSQRLAIAESARRNAEAAHAMGLSGHIAKRYSALNNEYLAHQLTASDAATGIGNVTKTIRLLLQSAVLGLGGYLVIENQLSPGAIIAASITVARALSPIETSITHWKGFVAARQAIARLGDLLLAMRQQEHESVVALPAPANDVRVEQIVVAAPGQTDPILRNVSFSIEKGDALGVIGPSGSGKSTLARALVGVWLPLNPNGAVRVDGASLDQWRPEALGKHIGYMPQDVELFSGTVAENIARFEGDATSEKVVAAAIAAGAHDTIVRLPDGYQTVIGDGGRSLSGGERQRVALARALYGDPFLVVLDEPNANLDANGEAALAEAISSVRMRGGVAIVIAHRPSALAAVNRVLMLQDGQVRAFGPRDEVLRSVLQPAAKSAADAPAPLKTVGAAS